MDQYRDPYIIGTSIYINDIDTSVEVPLRDDGSLTETDLTATTCDSTP